MSNIPEIDEYRGNWARAGVDEIRTWRFPSTPQDELRLTSEQVDSLPRPQEIVQQVPNFPPSIPHHKLTHSEGPENSPKKSYSTISRYRRSLQLRKTTLEVAYKHSHHPKRRLSVIRSLGKLLTSPMTSHPRYHVRNPSLENQAAAGRPRKFILVKGRRSYISICTAHRFRKRLRKSCVVFRLHTQPGRNKTSGYIRITRRIARPAIPLLRSRGRTFPP